MAVCGRPVGSHAGEERFATNNNGVCNGHEHGRQFVVELRVMDHEVEVVVRSGHESVDGYVAEDDQWFHPVSLG
jgi:hypothetical protein